MIRTVCVAPPEELRRNCEAAAGLGLPWLAALPQKDIPLAIVGGGPSSREYLDRIVSWPGAVLAINGAYDWLQQHGRIADYVMGLDPQAMLAKFYRNPHPATKFYIASCCAPDVFDALSDSDVTLYSAPQGDETGGDVPGGPTAMTRAPTLAAILGFRDVTLFGADSCFLGDGSHVYGGSLPDGVIRVSCGGREWLTDLGYLAQAEYLAELLPAINKALRVTLAGDHLASALLSSGRWSLAR